MTNQFASEEYLELKNGVRLPLRPSNIKRFGLEPFCSNIKEFSFGVKHGVNKFVGYKPDKSGKKIVHWYFCKLDLKDGLCYDVKKIHRDVNKKPLWFSDSSIYGGDCHYFSQRMDDVRKHFITHHSGMSSDYIFKCTHCRYKNQSISDMRKHMDSCASIISWVNCGCKVSSINPEFLKNIDHWTGMKTGGLAFNLKFDTEITQKLLVELRSKTKFLDVSYVVKTSTVESISGTTADENMSEPTSDLASISDLLSEPTSDLASISDLLDSEDGIESISDSESISDLLDSEDGIDYEFDDYPVKNDFNVKDELAVWQIYGDNGYRNGLTYVNKDSIMQTLAKEILEQRMVLEWGRKLSFLRKKCDGRPGYLQSLWDLQEVYDGNLLSYIVKSEDRESDSPVMRDLFAGSVAAVNLAKISRLLDEFNQNVPQISNSEIDLTDDTEPEMKEKLQKLEAENSVTSESLVKSLKSLKESSFEKSKLNNELSQSVLKNNELLKENSRLKNLQASCQKEMKLLKETEEKGKNCQN